MYKMCLKIINAQRQNQTLPWRKQEQESLDSITVFNITKIKFYFEMTNITLSIFHRKIFI